MDKLTITSLDKDLDAGIATLNFGGKEIIFGYKDTWFYRFNKLDSFTYQPKDKEIYGTYRNVSDWAVSKDVKQLIAWLDAVPN